MDLSKNLFLLDNDEVVKGVEALKGRVPKAYLFCDGKNQLWWLCMTTNGCDTYADAQSIAQKVKLDGRQAQLLPIEGVVGFLDHVDEFNELKQQVNAVGMKVDYPVSYACRYWVNGYHRPVMGELRGGTVFVPEAEACVLLGVPYKEVRSYLA